jgi:hypothetical protein
MKLGNQDFGTFIVFTIGAHGGEDLDQGEAQGMAVLS